MEKPSLREQLENNVRFCSLLQDLHFVVAEERHIPESFGFETVVLESNQCRIRIEREKGAILLDMGPTWASATPDPHQHDVWFDHTAVRAFLLGSANWAKPEMEWDGNWVTWIDGQLTWLADKMQPYWKEACALFTKEAFGQTQQQLIDLRGRLAKERWGPSKP